MAVVVLQVDTDNETRIREALLDALRGHEMVPLVLLKQLAAEGLPEEDVRVMIWNLISLGKLEFSDEQKLRLAA